MILNIPLIKVRLFYRASAAIKFPVYTGSIFRGAFGIKLREPFCQTMDMKCSGCSRIDSCAYAKVFEGARVFGSDSAEAVSVDIPNPYIIEPLKLGKHAFEKGDIFSIDVILFGNAVYEIQHVVMAFINAGYTGFTDALIRADLVKVCQVENNNLKLIFTRDSDENVQPPSFVYQLNYEYGYQKCRVVMQTPLKITFKKKTVKPLELTPKLFLGSIIRRIRNLLANYIDEIKNSDSAILNSYRPDSVNFRLYSGNAHLSAIDTAINNSDLNDDNLTAHTTDSFENNSKNHIQQSCQSDICSLVHDTEDVGMQIPDSQHEEEEQSYKDVMNRTREELNKLPEWAVPFFRDGIYDLENFYEQVTITHRDLRWFDWERFSSRQNKRIPLGGIMGNFILDGNLEPFILFLCLGELLHAGKSSVLGFGKYRLEWLK